MGSLDELTDGTQSDQLRGLTRTELIICHVPVLSSHRTPRSASVLNAALRENLEGRGTLRKIRAELRAEIFQALDDKQARTSVETGPFAALEGDSSRHASSHRDRAADTLPSPSVPAAHQGLQKPPISDRNLIINELIREYLVFNKYRSTLSVLMAETGQPTGTLDRTFLAEQAGVVEDRNSRQLCDPQSLPLLLPRSHAHGRAID